MKFAYSDPPYLGQGRKHYGHQHDEADAWDSLDTHREHIEMLVDTFPEGWAMSLSSTSLWRILPLCPPDVRIGAWVKPFCAFKVNVNPAYAWEPVIFRGGRKRTREMLTVRDYVSAPITLRKGTSGAKPEDFCRWVFEILGAEPGDAFVDLFLGSGSVTDAWLRWCAEPRLVPDEAEWVQDGAA